MRELLFTYLDPYFFPKPTITINNYSNKVASFSTFSFKLIYYIDLISGIYYLCISILAGSEIIVIVHSKSYPGFAYHYKIASYCWYIHSLTKFLQVFIRHQPKYLIFQTRQHLFYDSLQPIHLPLVSFHIVLFDFLLALPLSADGFNLLMSVTCKFLKRITLIKGKNIQLAKNWAHVLLQYFNMIDWGFFLELNTNKDPKFFSKFQKALFTKLEVKLLYGIVYHPQIDSFSKCTKPNS